MRTLAFALLLVTGCVSATDQRTFYRRESAGYVGCAEERVVIRGQRYDSANGRHSWTAVCPGGRTYYCVRQEGAGAALLASAGPEGTRCHPADS